MLEVVRAERLKLRRMRLPALAVASGLGLASSIGLSMFGAAHRLATERNMETPWQNGVIGDTATNSILILPALVTLLTSLAFYVEHRGGMWKQLRLVPQSPMALHAAKFALLQTLVAIALATALLVCLAGWHGLPQVLRDEMSIPTGTAYRNMGWLTFALYLSLLPVAAVQFVLSARLSNILHPVGIGLTLTFASLALFGPATAPYLPYAWPGAIVIGSYPPAKASEVQRPDLSFQPRAGALVGARPRQGSILVDIAHSNRHSLRTDSGRGSIGWIGDAASEAGITIQETRGKLRPELLRDVDLLIIGAASQAPTAEEVTSVEAWLRKGGSLLLLTDHEPFATPARGLAARLGVGMSIEMIAGTEPHSNRRMYVVPSRGTKRVLRVRTYGGQALWREGVEDGRLLPLDTPVAISQGGVVEPPAPAAQLLAFHFGEGRVVISGDSALFTAQTGESGAAGVNDNTVDNENFVISVLRWLLRQSTE